MLIVMISRSRSGVSRRSVLIPTSARASVIAGLAVGEGDRLPPARARRAPPPAADREVAPLRPADVVLGHQDPGQSGMPAEDDPEEVVDLALLRVGGGEEL